MKSSTKITLNKNDIQTLVDHAFSGQTVVSITELTDGWFNTIYKVTLDSQTVVLKVGSPKNAVIMSYEKQMMQSEIACNQLIQNNTNIPCAKILFSDLTRNLIPYQYFFMEFIDAKTWKEIEPTLNDNQIDKLKQQLGKISKQANSITGENFGFFNAQMTFDNWFDAFYYMCELAFKDAIRFNTPLPFNHTNFLSLLTQHQSIFLDIKQAHLVFWDLWIANIFVDKNCENIISIIDLERSIWGDPLMENVLFGINENHDSYFQGYGENLLDQPNKQTKRIFYNIYLLLIMVIEDGPRNYDDKSAVNWAKEELIKQFNLLQTR